MGVPLAPQPIPGGGVSREKVIYEATASGSAAAGPDSCLPVGTAEALGWVPPIKEGIHKRGEKKQKGEEKKKKKGEAETGKEKENSKLKTEKENALFKAIFAQRSRQTRLGSLRADKTPTSHDRHRFSQPPSPQNTPPPQPPWFLSQP